MNDTYTQRFKSILFSPLGRNDNPAALRRVVELAQRNEATLTLFGVAAERPNPRRFRRQKDILERLVTADRELAGGFRALSDVRRSHSDSQKRRCRP